MLMERAAVVPPQYANQHTDLYWGQLLRTHTNAVLMIQYETAKTPTDNSRHLCGSAGRDYKV